jgi:hypothetical protein
MPRDAQRSDNGSRSPEERYEKFERENAEWSRRVDRSVRKLDKVTKRSGRNADSGKTTSA